MFTTDCYKEGTDGLSYASICISCVVICSWFSMHVLGIWVLLTIPGEKMKNYFEYMKMSILTIEGNI